MLIIIISITKLQNFQRKKILENFKNCNNEKYGNNYLNIYSLKYFFSTKRELNYKSNRKDKRNKIKQIVTIARDILSVVFLLKISKILYIILIGLDTLLIFIFVLLEILPLNFFYSIIFEISIVDIPFEIAPSFATFEDATFNSL